MTVLELPRLRSFAVLGGVCSCCTPAAGPGTKPDTKSVQGYVEAEFVSRSEYAGPLETVYVRRRAQVKAGDKLFALDSALEKMPCGTRRRGCSPRHGPPGPT